MAVVLVDIDGVINAQWDRPDDLAEWPADSWHKSTITLHKAGLTGPLTYSQRVIDGLRRIEQRRATQMVWCTTWYDDAVTTLAPLIGLGGDWPVAGRDLPAELAWMDWPKAARAFEAAATHSKVVWIDDHAIGWFGRQVDAGLERELGWLFDKVLIIAPDARRGLTAEHFAEIEDFLA